MGAVAADFRRPSGGAAASFRRGSEQAAADFRPFRGRGAPGRANIGTIPTATVAGFSFRPPVPYKAHHSPAAEPVPILGDERYGLAIDGFAAMIGAAWA
jgi:hypothetical protein